MRTPNKIYLSCKTLLGARALQKAVPSFIHSLLIRTYGNDKDINLLWIPSHVGPNRHDHVNNFARNTYLLPAPPTSSPG